jgi:ribosomal protein L11 methyltransferase
MSATSSTASKTCLARTYPALDVRSDDPDLLLADVDDFHPTAVEDRDGITRIFFTTTADRDAARNALESRYPSEPLDVSDEDWARRSQENLKPITVGRLTIFPKAVPDPSTNPEALAPTPCALVILPSMGFGTGHHATTQLCLDALQTLALDGAEVLDVGTGSGVLALAAVRLGASRAIGIDVDNDAIVAARENLTFNPDLADRVSFETRDMSSIGDNTLAFDPDIVTANLTGALLIRSAAILENLPGRRGTLILSGLQVHERDDVVEALSNRVVWERTLDEWVALAVKKS